MRPVAHASDEIMFDGIDVDVIDVPLKVPVVADRVLPKSPLPQRVFAIRMARDSHAGFGDGSREAAFDQLPPGWIVRVSLRQGHDDVQMIRQNDNRIDGERMCPPRGAKRPAQGIDLVNQGVRRSIDERYCEEIRSTRDEISPISNHARAYPELSAANLGRSPG